MNRILFAVSLLAVPGTAFAQDAASPRQAYQDVMQAQYAARQAPLAVSAEEAQRIYDAYLKSIGHPAPKTANDAGGRAEIPSR
jgi:hypothetical protein